MKDQQSSRKGAGKGLDAETVRWMLGLTSEELVDVLFNAGRIPAGEKNYWLEFMPKLRAPRSESTRVELGCPGHLIVASRCRWKRHTQVGNYRVSSIGDYYPDGDRGKRDTIGAGESSFFETLVFKTTDELDPGNEGCGCRKVAEWSEIDGERYATAGEAQAGHERYVEKYSRGERGG